MSWFEFGVASAFPAAVTWVYGWGRRARLVQVEGSVVLDRTELDSQALSREHEESIAPSEALDVDRRRVVMSSAFRRLQHKAQVFIGASSDHFRTRLTHTLEVADVARELARSVAANERLAEVIALAHDLGHPPFGHAGERALDRCLHERGGFEHNAHSLRVVEQLEHPYPAFRGLNLTRVVRECLAKHSTAFDAPASHPLQDGRPAPIEGRIAALADQLAYTLHDLQDGVHAGLLSADDLSRVSAWREAWRGPSSPSASELRARLRPTVDEIRRVLVTAIAASFHCGLNSASQGASPEALVRERLAPLSALLMDRVYRNPQVCLRDRRGARVLAAVFEAHLADPRRLPERFGRRVSAEGIDRVVTDYVAGMTDRFCLRVYRTVKARRSGSTAAQL
ncbi:MAG: dNTP triphosphohydrolase [Planctomycetia bacterium]|nr:MAG: dNTP triphosphohydrolase [Planctomycetia bacterium]